MAGGGADAYPLFDALLTAVPRIQEAGPCHLVLVTGPFLPAEQRGELVSRAHGLPVDVLISVSDPMSYAASADLVVAMAGYNTTAELLSVGTRTLLVPRRGPSAEQQMRARLFADRGWVDWLRPQDLGPDTLGSAVLTALREPRPTMPVRPPDLAGRTVGTDWLIESLEGRHRDREQPDEGVRADHYLLA
jgi:predicted glycosyltransferase